MNSHDIIVSPSGDDKNPGTPEAPLRTPEAAKEKAKALKNADCGHITVWFREGVYRLSDTLVFTEEDLSDVTYRSYPNERVAFSGAREISGWTRTSVNGVSAFVTDCDTSSPDGYFNALYNGEVRLRRPVYPKTGEFSVVQALDSDALSADTSGYFKLHAAFYANPADIMSFKNLNDVDVRILHFWNDELLPIAHLDTQNGRIEMQKPASMTICEADRFFFENVFEALCEPGEWYLDRTDKKLYYIPFAGETPEETVLYAGITEQIITLDGCNNINFEGIGFCDTAWDIHSGEHFPSYRTDANEQLLQNIKYSPNAPQACYDSPCAITLTKCKNISFVNCSFERIGSSALMFGPGCESCCARTCEFDNIGGNAVYIKGVNDKTSADITHDIVVTDCHIKTYGRIFNNAIGVLLIHAYNCEISQNEIHDGFYTAISSGWVWGYSENITDNIKIQNNLIYDIGQGWLADMGGIYTLGIQPNSVISGNVIHNVGCYAGSSGYGGWGIYLDEGSSRITVENNLAYNCSSQGFHQHYGEDNLIRNNIFALNGDGQFRITRLEEHNSLFLYSNIFVSDDTPIYLSLVENKFTDDKNLYWDYNRGKKVFSCKDDVNSEKISKSAAERMGYYNNGVFADPMFKDAENGDFTLAVNSPAYSTGFKSWDYSAAGTLTQF
ncbi:MAG: right-handed parallel beta-helix repeat-containing protein [Clostridiales bacterium]|nr:right-handed parallel beta-helix repeat-containing protein [Clostridiales bacterium]